MRDPRRDRWARAGLLASVLLTLLSVASCGSDHASGSQENSSMTTAAPIVAVGRCLNGRGWDVTVDDVENSIEFSGTSQQMQAYDADYTDCESQFGTKAIPFAKFTEDMWRDLYDQETATAQCLRGRGIDVPSIPSYETYVQRYQSSDPWTAYSFAPASSASVERDLNVDCPQPDL